MARDKLTQKMVDLAIQYKGEGCTNDDIIRMLGLVESIFYHWTCHPKGRLQRALSERLKGGGPVQAHDDRHHRQRGAGEPSQLDGGDVTARAQVTQRVCPGAARHEQAPRGDTADRARSCSGVGAASAPPRRGGRSARGRWPGSGTPRRRSGRLMSWVNASELCISHFHDVPGNVMALMRRHARRQTADGDVPQGVRPECAVGAQGPPPQALLQLAGEATRNLHQSQAGAAHLGGVSAKECERDKDGTWVDDIPSGNDHSIDAVRYAVMNDVLRG